MAEESGGSGRELALRWWRRLYWWRLDRATRREFPCIETAIYYGISLGDNLLCTAVAREWHARHGGQIAILTPTPEFFAFNPHVHSVHPFNVNRLHSLNRLGVRVIRPDYALPSSDPDCDIPPRSHLIADMCATAGLTGRVALKPEIFFSAAELESNPSPAVHARPKVAIMSGGATAAIPMLNKDWPVERWQRVIELGRSRCDFVQLGSSHDNALFGAQDMRGRTTLRETAVFLKTCSAFVGQVGLLMHLARAVDCPSVIVFGGREHPRQSGYCCNENLYSPVACAPCWRRNGCEHGRMCLDAITPLQVWTALERILGRTRAPLLTEEITL
jgi:hypothetical protein